MKPTQGPISVKADIGRSRFFSRYHLLLLISAPLIPFFLLVSPWLSLAVIVFDLAIISIAPFVQRWQFFLPIITKSKTSSNSVSLTFDDGPDVVLTPRLLDLLKKHKIKATFFVIGQKAAANPELIQKIIRDGHEIGNHSYSHDTLLMLRKKSKLYHEISECRKILTSLGVHSYAFRPPVGITNPKLGSILVSLGLYCVGFSCRAVDFGNRRPYNIKRTIVKKAKAGDIILLHDKRPQDNLDIQNWLNQVEEIILELPKKGLNIVPLSTLIDRSVMKILDSGSVNGTVQVTPIDNILETKVR